MAETVPHGLNRDVAKWLTPLRAMPLDAGKPQIEFRDRLAKLTADDITAPRPVSDRLQADACRAGLWLYFGFLDEAHRIVQAIDTPEASYWHAVMHRREGDYANAKYWVRQAGHLPIFDELAQIVAVQGGHLAEAMFSGGGGDTSWDGAKWVDVCRAACTQRAPFDAAETAESLRQIQQAEWRLLLAHCLRLAVA